MKKRAYYNEHNAYAAAWLRGLIAAGLIADGEVDERSIEDVLPDELDGFAQCHFFAGIGGWSAALRLAGWPDGKPVWTGSCPCQSFSAAGRRKGFADERHLWPAWYHLIEQCRPPVIFGEQVASKDALAWLDLVCADLEGAGYAVGATDLCAAGVGAPHIRQRLWFVANSVRVGRSGRCDGDTARGCGQIQIEGRSSSIWDNPEWIDCLDGKKRPTQPGLLPLVDGVPFRLADGRTREVAQTKVLEGIGNAIVPQVAGEFIMACMALTLHTR